MPVGNFCNLKGRASSTNTRLFVPDTTSQDLTSFNPEPSGEVEVRYGLKEWTPVIEATCDGNQIILIHKGGILDQDGFSLPSLGAEYFLLYPAYYHRNELFLKERYSHYLHRKERRRSEEARIDFVVSVTDVFECAEIEGALKLSAHHVWSDAYIRTRFNYRTDIPVKVLCVRAHHLDEPITMPPKDATGCRSWVEFNPSLYAKLGRPVLRDEEYFQRVHEVKSLVGARQYSQDDDRANSG